MGYTSVTTQRHITSSSLRYESVYGFAIYNIKIGHGFEQAQPCPIFIFCMSQGSYTLERYSPVLVSILIVSPWFTKSGTLRVAPVSTVHGFVVPVAVSPLTHGSHSVISSSTKSGGSTAKT